LTPLETPEELICNLLETGDIKSMKFILIHTNAYCGDNWCDYIPAELGVSALTFDRGIIDNYWFLVDPGRKISFESSANFILEIFESKINNF